MAVRFLASKSASTHMGGSRLSSVAGLPLCSPQSFTSHLIGAPSPSFLRKNSRLTFGKLRSNDDTIRLFARRIAAFSVLLIDDGCAHKQTVSSRTQRLRIICRMPLLDTSRLREAHVFEVTTLDWSGPLKPDCRNQAITEQNPRQRNWCAAVRRQIRNKLGWSLPSCSRDEDSGQV